MLKLPLNATDCYAYNSVPSAESLKLITIAFRKMGQNGKGQNAQLFIKLFVALSGLGSNYNLYRLQSY